MLSKTILKKYKEKVDNNPKTTCMQQKQVVKYVEHVLSLEWTVFNEELADWYLKFINKYCFAETGNELTLEQSYLICVAMGIRDKNDIRIFSEIYIKVARGFGKTGFISALFVAMFYRVGKSTHNFYNLAYTKEQAQEVSKELMKILETDVFEEQGFKVLGKNQNQKIINEDWDDFSSEIRTNQEAQLNGLKVTGAILDEVATWKSQQTYETIRDGMKDIDSTMISITTAGHVDEGVDDYLMERSNHILDEKNWSSEIEDDLFPFIFKADDFEKWFEIDEIKKANPSFDLPYFATRKKTITKKVKELLKGIGDRAEYFTKTLNIKVAGDNSFFDDMYLKSDSDTDLKDYEYDSGKLWIGGLDLGHLDDFTSFSMVCYDSEKDKFIINNKSWISREKYENHLNIRDFPVEKWVKKGWLEIAGDKMINNNIVMDYIVEQQEKYNLEFIGYDPSGMNAYINKLLDGGLACKKVFTNATFMNEPMYQALEYSYNDGLDLLGNNCLKWQLKNVIALKDNTSQERIRPIKSAKKLKIDGAVATFTAMSRRLSLIKSGVIDEND